jgi:hypothetical protein
VNPIRVTIYVAYEAGGCAVAFAAFPGGERLAHAKALDHAARCTEAGAPSAVACITAEVPPVVTPIAGRVSS